MKAIKLYSANKMIGGSLVATTGVPLTDFPVMNICDFDKSTQYKQDNIYSIYNIFEVFFTATDIDAILLLNYANISAIEIYYWNVDTWVPLSGNDYTTAHTPNNFRFYLNSSKNCDSLRFIFTCTSSPYTIAIGELIIATKLYEIDAINFDNMKRIPQSKGDSYRHIEGKLFAWEDYKKLRIDLALELLTQDLVDILDDIYDDAINGDGIGLYIEDYGENQYLQCNFSEKLAPDFDNQTTLQKLKISIEEI